ncbi:uncharacterized protein LOC117343353 [Pecten maximus]|uniref:uncharacterized protein LOC117343353 n=1 Tax=Pecten maximus TaxID=6579 RepID=UPI001458EDD6|nr:uncharacterized protein LOC117343353 [Pecten maximus]
MAANSVSPGFQNEALRYFRAWVIFDSLEKVFRDLHEDVKNLKVRLDDIEESQTFINRKFEETRVYHTDLSKLHDDVIDLKCRSMRENLLFFGIPEEGGPDFVDRSDPTTGISERVPNEDCIDKLKTLASQKLDFTENLLIDRAHRIGPKTTGKVRPIVAKFNQFQQKERLKKKSNKLKGSNIYISDQYPKEVQEVRRELWPIWKKARDDKKRAVFVKDKLYIDGVLYKCPDPPVPSANVQAPGNPRGAPKGAHTRKRHP